MVHLPLMEMFNAWKSGITEPTKPIQQKAVHGLGMERLVTLFFLLLKTMVKVQMHRLTANLSFMQADLYQIVQE